MDFRDKLIRQFADAACTSIARKVIRYLQTLTDCRMSGDDTVLANVWDEFCVQVQYDESIFWDAYVMTAKQCINSHVEKLPMHINQAIWLQTDDGIDCEIDNEGETLDSFQPTDVITDYIFSWHLVRLAEDWSNKRIEEYLWNYA